MAVKLFQGKDRREINKAINVLVAIEARDDKARDTATKTQALSTRTEVVPASDAALTTDFTNVRARLVACLAMTR